MGLTKDNAMKTLWVTSLGTAKESVQQLMAQLKTYGLAVEGHFWQNDLKQFAWTGAKAELLDPKIALWAILGSPDELLEADHLYGLSSLALSIQAQRGQQFPIVLLQTEGDPIGTDKLSTPLKGALAYPADDSGLGAKLVAKVHTPAKAVEADYHLDIHADEKIGQWFEVHPTRTDWPGAMLGVAGGEITFQAVGPAGGLPSKTELNYPMQGLQLELGTTTYTAWAVQNPIDANTSYYVKIDGFPESIIFGPYATDETGDVFVIKLK
jgi:hypothetical protein